MFGRLARPEISESRGLRSVSRTTGDRRLPGAPPGGKAHDAGPALKDGQDRRPFLRGGVPAQQQELLAPTHWYTINRTTRIGHGRRW
jgi:hypothetical protein